MKCAILAALAVVTSAGTALAGSPLPSFAALPQSPVLAPPTTKPPAHIAASEKVPGFYFASPPTSGPSKKKRVASLRFVQLFASEEEAKAVRRGTPRNHEVCFALDPKERLLDDDEAPEERRWSGLQQVLAFNTSRDEMPVSVRAVHAERIVQSGESASLESTDVWVDPETKGVRLIGRATAPLKLLGAVPNGPRVWAMRTGDDRLELVVTQEAQMLARGESLMAFGSRGGDEATACTHLRVSLKVEKGSAESVSILGAAELPPIDRPEGRGAKSNGDVRIRPVRIHTSVSWTTRDAAPVIALSFGWEARGRVLPGERE